MFRTNCNPTSLPENPLPSIFLFQKQRMFKFKKYQSAILRSSRPDYVTTLEKNLEGHFPGLNHFFKSHPKRGDFNQHSINFTEIFII